MLVNRRFVNSNDWVTVLLQKKYVLDEYSKQHTKVETLLEGAYFLSPKIDIGCYEILFGIWKHIYWQKMHKLPH